MLRPKNCMKCGGKRKMQGGGSQSDDEWIRKILEYEVTKGHASGNGLPNFGYNSRKVAPRNIEEGIDFFKQDYLPKLSQYPMGLRERIGDYIYNTGRNPNDLLLYNAGKIDLNTINSTKDNSSLWNQYKGDIEKMYSDPAFINNLDFSKDNIYKTTKQINGAPNPAYNNSWKGRVSMWGTYNNQQPAQQGTQQTLSSNQLRGAPNYNWQNFSSQPMPVDPNRPRLEMPKPDLTIRDGDVPFDPATQYPPEHDTTGIDQTWNQGVIEPKKEDWGDAQANKAYEEGSKEYQKEYDKSLYEGVMKSGSRDEKKKYKNFYRDKWGSPKTKIDPFAIGLGLQAGTTALSYLGNMRANNQQNQYDYRQQTALGQMNPMPYAQQGGIVNPYSYYLRHGGNLKNILENFNKFSNDAPMDFGDGKLDNQGLMKKGGLTPNKARKILHDGTVHGKPITDKQRRFFGAKSKGHTNYKQSGGSIVDYLKSEGIDSSKDARKKLYEEKFPNEQYKYRGDQNIKLLNTLRGQKSSEQPQQTVNPVQQAPSVNRIPSPIRPQESIPIEQAIIAESNAAPKQETRNIVQQQKRVVNVPQTVVKQNVVKPTVKAIEVNQSNVRSTRPIAPSIQYNGDKKLTASEIKELEKNYDPTPHPYLGTPNAPSAWNEYRNEFNLSPSGPTLAKGISQGTVSKQISAKDLTYNPNNIYRGVIDKQLSIAPKNCDHGVGCAEQAADVVATIAPGVNPVRQHAVFLSSALKENKAIPIFETENNTNWDPRKSASLLDKVPESTIKGLQMGDYVGLGKQKPDLPDQGMDDPESVALYGKSRKFFNERHWGIVVGFKEDGTPLVRHGQEGAAGQGTYQVDPINNINLGSGKYSIVSIYRQKELANNNISTVKDVGVNKKTVAAAKQATTGSKSFWVDDMKEQYNMKGYGALKELSGFNVRTNTKNELVKLFNDKTIDGDLKYKLGVTQDELDKMKTLVYGIVGQETNFNDVDSLARNLKEFLGDAFKSDPSTGPGQVKVGSLTEIEKQMLGINRPSQLHKIKDTYKAILTILNTGRKYMNDKIEQGIHPGLKDMDQFERALYFYNSPGRASKSAAEFLQDQYRNNPINHESRNAKYTAPDADIKRAELRGDKGSYVDKVKQHAKELKSEIDLNKEKWMENVTVRGVRTKKGTTYTPKISLNPWQGGR